MEDIYRRIPHRPPFLFVDEILEINEEGAKASLLISPDLSFFEGHYPGNPIMPGVLLCESIFQTGAIFLSEHMSKKNALTDSDVTPVLSRIRDARFKRMVKPGDKVILSVFLVETIGQFFNLRGEVHNDGKVAMTISFALALVENS
tara:strand:- start:2442 stop:2879 length:438 start_codon:yes stop_codon:yes gene_type:complete